MTLGEQVLAELGRLGQRYGRFTYEEHQQLKQVDSRSDLNAFLASHDFPQVGPDDSMEAIVGSLQQEWSRRDTKEVKKGVLTGLLSAPEGVIILVLLSPLLLGAYIVRTVHRYFTQRD